MSPKAPKTTEALKRELRHIADHGQLLSIGTHEQLPAEWGPYLAVIRYDEPQPLRDLAQLLGENVRVVGADK